MANDKNKGTYGYEELLFTISKLDYLALPIEYKQLLRGIANYADFVEPNACDNKDLVATILKSDYNKLPIEYRDFLRDVVDSSLYIDPSETNYDDTPVEYIEFPRDIDKTTHDDSPINQSRFDQLRAFIGFVPLDYGCIQRFKRINNPNSVPLKSMEFSRSAFLKVAALLAAGTLVVGGYVGFKLGAEYSHEQYAAALNEAQNPTRIKHGMDIDKCTEEFFSHFDPRVKQSIFDDKYNDLVDSQNETGLKEKDSELIGLAPEISNGVLSIIKDKIMVPFNNKVRRKS